MLCKSDKPSIIIIIIKKNLEETDVGDYLRQPVRELPGEGNYLNCLPGEGNYLYCLPGESNYLYCLPGEGGYFGSGSGQRGGLWRLPTLGN